MSFSAVQMCSSVFCISPHEKRRETNNGAEATTEAGDVTPAGSPNQLDASHIWQISCLSTSEPLDTLAYVQWKHRNVLGSFKVPLEVGHVSWQGLEKAEASNVAMTDSVRHGRVVLAQHACRNWCAQPRTGLQVRRLRSSSWKQLRTWQQQIKQIKQYTCKYTTRPTTKGD